MSTTDLSAQRVRQQQRHEAMLHKAMARTLAADKAHARQIQNQLTPGDTTGRRPLPNALDKSERLAARQAIYGADLRARQLAAQPERRPIGDLQIRAGEAQSLSQGIQAMNKLAANVGVDDLATKTQKRIRTAREQTRDAVKEGTTEFVQNEVMQGQVARAFALMNPSDGLAAFSFRSAEAEAAELGKLANQVPTNLAERVAASAGMQHSPARTAIIQRAIAAEALARFAKEAQVQQARSQTQDDHSSVVESAVAVATLGLLAEDANDDLTEELVTEGVEALGAVITLAAVPVELGLGLAHAFQ